MKTLWQDEGGDRYFYALAFLMVLAQAVFVAAYVGAERTIYFWDHAMYFSMAQTFFELWSRDFVFAGDYFMRSLESNYPAFFALPSVVSFSVFGVSRTVFILTNFFAFFLIQEAAMALILRRAFRLRWAQALVLSLAATSCLPSFWIPLLQGYPDNSALAALLIGAVFLFDERRDARRALMAGVFLALSFLLRRHYVYAGAPLLLVCGGCDLWNVWRKRTTPVLSLVKFYGLCGAALVGTALLLAPDLVMKAVATDYTALYDSYNQGATRFKFFVFKSFGFGVFAFTLFSVAVVLRALPNAIVSRVGLWVVVWGFLWCAGPAQIGPHYVLQVLPFAAAFFITGFIVAFWRSAREPRQKRKAQVVLFAIGLLLFSGSAFALWFAPEGVEPNAVEKPGILPAPHPPVVRKDLAEIEALAGHLLQATTEDEKILVLGSSFTFNQDVLLASLRQKEDVRAAFALARRVLSAPEIDRVQGAPFDVFASADVFVVPEPAQYHLPPQGQKVVTAAAAQFPPRADRAAFFEKGARVFALEKGVKVSVWRRTKTLPPEVLLTILDDVAEITGEALPDWVVVHQPFRAGVATVLGKQVGAKKTTAAQGIFSDFKNMETMSLFFTQPLTEGGVYRFSAQLNPRGCIDARFTQTFTAANGKEKTTDVFRAAQTLDGGRWVVVKDFRVAKGVAKPKFLTLNITTTRDPRSSEGCQILLDNLKVERRL